MPATLRIRLIKPVLSFLVFATLVLYSYRGIAYVFCRRQERFSSLDRSSVLLFPETTQFIKAKRAEWTKKSAYQKQAITDLMDSRGGKSRLEHAVLHNGHFVKAAEVEGWLQRASAVSEADYLKVHKTRLVNTLLMTIPQLKPTDTILEIGSRGSTPILLRKFAETTGNLHTLTLYDEGFAGLTKSGGFTDDRSHPDLLFGVDLVKGDAEVGVWPFKSAETDVILMFEVLEHFRRDPLHVFLEANRVLRKGGKIIFTTPNANSVGHILRSIIGIQPYLFSRFNPALSGIGHTHEYTILEVQQLCAASGFDVDIQTTFSPYSGDWDDNAQDFISFLQAEFEMDPRLTGSTHFVVCTKRDEVGSLVLKNPQPLYFGDAERSHI